MAENEAVVEQITLMMKDLLQDLKAANIISFNVPAVLINNAVANWTEQFLSEESFEHDLEDFS